MRNPMRSVIPLAVGLLLLTGACGGGGDGDGEEAAALLLATFQPASQVIGQVDFFSGEANRGAGTPDADTLNGPQNLCDACLLITDSANHRILGFSSPPVGDGQAADILLGQPAFTTSIPGTTAGTLMRPSDVLVAGGRLIVADTDNNRVLIWNSLPAASNVPADVVVGQDDFTSRDPATSQTGLTSPRSVLVVANRLIVSDLQNSRILIWNSIPAVNGAPADVVLGQPDFVSSGSAGGPSGLAAPGGLWTDGQRLICADVSNHRVLIWNSIPVSNAAPADVVVGQPDFFVTTDGAGPQKMKSPFDVASDGTRLFVADSFNNRVLIFDEVPTISNVAADAVLGQGNFTNVTRNDDDQDGMIDATPSPRTFENPLGVAVIDGRLYVSDTFNNRVLVFE